MIQIVPTTSSSKMGIPNISLFNSFPLKPNKLQKKKIIITPIQKINEET
jgi:hypothetical protein